MKKRKLALIGVNLNHAEHIASIVNNKSVDLVAVCNTDNKVAELTAKFLKVPFYVTADDLLNNEKLEAAIVSIPHNEYFPVIKKLLANNIHILKEKPFANNLNEALLLLSSIRESKSKVMIVAQRRSHPTYVKAQELMQTLGNIEMVTGNYHLDRLATRWRKDIEKAGGGVILDLGFHIIDLLNWYFGLPSSVYAKTKLSIAGEAHSTEDNAALIFSYASGTIATITFTRLATDKDEVIRIYGSKGQMEISRSILKVKYKNGKKFQYKVENNWNLAFSNQLNTFIKSIDKSDQALFDEKRFLDNSLVIEAAYMSAKLNQEVNPLHLFRFNKYADDHFMNKTLWKEYNAYSYN